MQNNVDLMLDRYISVVNTIRVAEGIYLHVNSGANSILRVKAIEKSLDANPMTKLEYYKAILEACVPKDEYEKFVSLDPQPWVWELVMAAVKKQFVQANIPFFGEVEIEGEEEVHPKN